MNTCWKVLWLAAALAMVQPVVAQDRTDATPVDALPPKALILGVPFVGWSEAAQLDYPNKDILNPASIAVSMMQQKFWGRDPTRFNLFAPRVFVQAEWLGGDGTIGLGLEDLKRPVARGIPVYVQLTLTPYANPMSVAARLDRQRASWGKSRDAQGGVQLSFAEVRQMIDLAYKKPQTGEASSGALGEMATLETLRRLGASSGPYQNQRGEMRSAEYLHLRESLYSSPRLLIGYDDERRVMIVHDPSFGPALEIGYDDFDIMWRYKGRVYDAATPAGFESILAKRTSAVPYPARTPDMQAALQFVTGYALAQIGRTGEAVAAFERGLALPNVGPGYRFMLAFEAAHLHIAEHRADAAVAALRLATDAIPQGRDAWGMLAKLYRQNPALPDGDRLAVEAETRLKSVCCDRAAWIKFVNTVPRDFYVEGLAQERGWGYEKLGR